MVTTQLAAKNGQLTMDDVLDSHFQSFLQKEQLYFITLTTCTPLMVCSSIPYSTYKDMWDLNPSMSSLSLMLHTLLPFHPPNLIPTLLSIIFLVIPMELDVIHGVFKQNFQQNFYNNQLPIFKSFIGGTMFTSITKAQILHQWHYGHNMAKLN